MQRYPLVVSLLICLSGCGHTLTLMSSDGAMGKGVATGVGGKGDMEVRLNGKVYKGTRVVAQGGSVGFGSVGGTTFTSTSMDGGTTGNAMLTAGEGDGLQCRFVYGGFSGTGYGQCRDSAGKQYELQSYSA